MTAALKPWLQYLAGATAILLLTLSVYGPATNGQFIWDDEQHVGINRSLAGPKGLARIWFDPGATQQYYPMAQTVFWIEFQLWGVAPLGYHLVNVVLHAGNAFLLWLLLKRLLGGGRWPTPDGRHHGASGIATHVGGRAESPGDTARVQAVPAATDRLAIPTALAAALVFAVHPVHAESVAWISEMKNTLSGAFYLGAMLLLLEFCARRGAVRWAWYAGGAALFCCGLASKTVAASLPAALVVILWWKRERLGWPDLRDDILPLVPLAVLGVAMGLFTAHWEKVHVGAVGWEFDLSPFQRVLIAGRALWFYVEKLIWPADLTFIYPRWKVDPAVWWQWLFPAGAALAVAALFPLRKRLGKGAVAGVLLFAGTLLPALGFVNIFPMQYSFVADHFQYLASIPMLVLFVVVLQRLIVSYQPSAVALKRAVWPALILVLALLTWRQAHIYAGPERLWTDTLAKNPECWMAHNNYGVALGKQGKIDEAIAHYTMGLQSRPDDPELLNNLGTGLWSQNRLAEAAKCFELALSVSPSYANAHFNLSRTYKKMGRFDQAVQELEQAIEAYSSQVRFQPTDYVARCRLGDALAEEGRFAEAEAQYVEALKIRPDSAETLVEIGKIQLGRGDVNGANDSFLRATRVQPEYHEAHYFLGQAALQSGRPQEAAAHFANSLRIRPDSAETLVEIGKIQLGRGDVNGANDSFLRATRVQPEYHEAHYFLGQAALQSGRPREAAAHFANSLRVRPDYVLGLNSLAWIRATSADASLRHGPEAVQLAQRAVQLTQGQEPFLVDTLACAYAEAGRFEDAIRTCEQAVALARAAVPLDSGFVAEMESRLGLFGAGRAFHQETPVTTKP